MFDNYDDDFTGNIEYCSQCDCPIYTSDSLSDHKHIDGLGMICSSCKDEFKEEDIDTMSEFDCLE